MIFDTDLMRIGAEKFVHQVFGEAAIEGYVVKLLRRAQGAIPEDAAKAQIRAAKAAEDTARTLPSG